MLDEFEQACLPCPICRARYRRGASIRIAARICLTCERCQFHCGCGAAQRLKPLPPIRGIETADEPLIIEESR
jgi:hypothetical protein